MTSFTWLGHSTVHVRVADGPAILIDPWLQGNPAFPSGYDVAPVDLVLITHGHFDHLDLGDLRSLVERFEPEIVCNAEISMWLGSKDVPNVVGMNKGGCYHSKGVRISMTQAQHSSSILEDGKIIYAGEPAGLVVRQPDGRAFYHAGDTNVFSDMSLIRRLYEPELAMLPIGDLFTMGPKEAALACEFLQPKLVIPIHYKTFPLLTGTAAKLREELGAESGVAVRELEPGVAFDW